MTAAQVLSRAREAGVRIEPRGGKLCLRAPEKPPDELLDLLRQHKPEILAHLRRGIGPACAPELHRRCSGCGCGLQLNDPDLGLCHTCKWTQEYLMPEPRRVQ